MASLAMLLNGTSLFWDHQYHKRFLEHPFLPDIRGKIVIMIQGSEGDFSERTSQQLVKLGAKVYIFDQTLSKREGLCEDDKGDVCRIQCDMTNLESVRHAALVFMAHENCVSDARSITRIASPNSYSSCLSFCDLMTASLFIPKWPSFPSKYSYHLCC